MASRFPVSLQGKYFKKWAIKYIINKMWAYPTHIILKLHIILSKYTIVAKPTTFLIQ